MSLGKPEFWILCSGFLNILDLLGGAKLKGKQAKLQVLGFANWAAQTECLGDIAWSDVSLIEFC